MAESEGESREDLHAERIILDRAIGGWRGVLDSGLPTAVFVTAYTVTGQRLPIALIAAVAVALILAVLRLIQRKSLQQVLAGLAGVVIAAAFSAFTGRAEDFFLPGVITNAVYGTAFLISIVVGWPLLGVIVGLLTGQGMSWRASRELRRVFSAASWIWVGLFFGRLVVQGPLYFAGEVELLGIVRIVLGWPAFIAAAYFTYVVLAPTYRQMREKKI
ncbi:MAG: DUF3159 domain-containing protein [Actinobacteria bacterium]|nr:DUF3159 domain-containing protein [Actinomycetota bacterium]